LNNDERLAMRYCREVLPTVIEVRRIVSGDLCQCVDLLGPNQAPFLLYDSAMAQRSVRFARAIGWVVRSPHVAWLSGKAMEVEPSLYADWVEQLTARLQAAAVNRPDLTLKGLLAEDYTAALELLGQVEQTHRGRLVAALDAFNCAGSYQLAATWQEVDIVLRSKPDFEAVEAPQSAAGEKPLAYYYWHRKGESAQFGQPQKPGEGSVVDGAAAEQSHLGAVYLYEHALLVRAVGKAKYEFMRRMLDHYLGPLVRFDGETVIDLLKEMGEQREYQQAVQEARSAVYYEMGLAEHRAQEQLETDAPTRELAAPGEPPEAKHREAWEDFLTRTSPTLDGQTPIVAAADAALRPKLVELMKHHIRRLELENRRTGAKRDIDWVLDRLALPELK
jgi:hypothetical protein